MSDVQVRTLVDEFLAEQAASTAVERFSRAHDAGSPPPMSCPSAGPEPVPPGRRYRDLLPATPPGPGQQYAFEVDLDACSGCKACVVACGSLNGLPAGQSFRRTGTLIGGADRDLPVLRTVTTACHHCAEPGCLQGCPVDAYEKDPLTGVVRHLDDQCIGCRYCTLACPYEVPAYDADRGIVRKCDLCHDRLADGEAPACVQACPTRAIDVRVIDLDDLYDDEAAWPLPGPDPALTRPTTRYRTSEDLLDGVRAVDADTIALAHAHPPLTAMLVLTQAAVGTLVALVVGGWLAPRATADVGDAAAVTALCTGVVALAASVLHLGRPLQAWRAVIGLRHSWLSREIVAFGGFTLLTAAAAAALAGIPPLAGHEGWMAPLAAGVGIVAVGTSVMVYAVTGRRWWSVGRVAARFAATTALTGTSALLALLTATHPSPGPMPATSGLLPLLASLTLAVAAGDLGLLRHHRRHDPVRGRVAATDDELARVAWLHVRRMPWLVAARLGSLGLGAVALPWLALRVAVVTPDEGDVATVIAVAGAILVVCGELLERWRFFTASAPPRMPGSLR